MKLQVNFYEHFYCKSGYKFPVLSRNFMPNFTIQNSNVFIYFYFSRILSFCRDLVAITKNMCILSFPFEKKIPELLTIDACISILSLFVPASQIAGAVLKVRSAKLYSPSEAILTMLFPVLRLGSPRSHRSEFLGKMSPVPHVHSPVSSS